MIRIIPVFLFLFFTIRLFAQLPTQTIRGKVIDEATGVPLASVSVMLQNSGKGGTTDDNGNFVIEHVAIGRYNIEVSFTGYEPVILKEILVTSGKEVHLNISMKEMATPLQEVVIRP